MFRALRRLGTKFFRREDGTASVEFVMAIPVLLLVFVSSFENGLLNGPCANCVLGGW